MSDSAQNSGGSIPDAVILRIDHGASPAQRRSFIERLEPMLPHLNWRTHFFIVPESLPDDMGFTREIIQMLGRFLTANPLVTFHAHPVLHIGSAECAESTRWNELLDNIRPFQQQAYEQQTEARLSILPIIEPAVGTPDLHWLQAAQFFHANAAKPSVLLRGPDALEKARRAADHEIRFYIERDEQSGSDGLLRQLWINKIFEDLLERVKASLEGDDLYMPCRHHRLVDQPSNKVYSCFHDWSMRRAFDTFDSIFEVGARITGNRRPDACGGCISRSLCSMTDNLTANNSRSEGREVHAQMALALSGAGRHREAISHASLARDLASVEADRASASIVKGLCHLALGELEEADKTLAQASETAGDPGLVSFHRGRVQFEWRDYIEALDRFEEALASGSKAVPEIDLFYYMAVSHIHIQEYGAARTYLDRWSQTGQRQATLLYYRGLCDIGEGEFETALSALQASERAGPPEQDMGNTLFYAGFCLKELGRYEEAIPVLKRAAEFDPREIDIFNLLGFCFYKTARHREAVECFERAIALDPGSAIDYANLAVNLRELGRTEEAIAMYRRALALDPKIGFARNNLRQLTEEQNE